MQWEIVMEIFMNTGNLLIALLDFKEALFGSGSIR